MEDKLAVEKKEVTKELEIVRRNAARLQKLAEDMLQVSRIESGKFTIKAQDKVEDFNSLILDIVKDIEKKYDHTTDKKDKVSISFVPEHNDNNNVPERKKTTTTIITAAATGRRKRIYSWFVLCDRPKISEILFSLIDNAMKFTERGIVTIYSKKLVSYMENFLLL
jgi:signal transduction histidine kinase